MEASRFQMTRWRFPCWFWRAKAYVLLCVIHSGPLTAFQAWITPRSRKVSDKMRRPRATTPKCQLFHPRHSLPLKSSKTDVNSPACTRRWRFDRGGMAKWAVRWGLSRPMLNRNGVATAKTVIKMWAPLWVPQKIQKIPHPELIGIC